jgi:hypothetical protein
MRAPTLYARRVSPIPPRTLAVLALALPLLAPARPAVADDAVPWAILPVRGEKPPPRDPTLLRLTRDVADALHAAVGAPVRVLSRDLRDEACPALDGRCGRDTALMVGAERALSLKLSESWDQLEVRIYDRRGEGRTGSLPCRWREGLAACDTAGLGALVSTRIPTKVAEAEPAPSPRRRRSEARAAARAAAKANARIERGYKKLGRRLERCKQLGWGELAGDDRVAAEIKFSVHEGGKVRDVRVVPAGLDGVPAYACMARVVEAMRLPKTTGSIAGPVQLPLPRL